MLTFAVFILKVGLIAVRVKKELVELSPGRVTNGEYVRQTV